MLPTDFLHQKFNAALPYPEYVRSGNTSQQDSWRRVYEQATLTTAQRQLVGAFERDIKVLVSSGVWCGDCVQQCPLIARIAEANPGRIDLRFVDRDEHADLAERVTICGGRRVPVVIFMAEDYEAVALAGDRTLSRYRAVAQRQLGPSCPLPGAPLDPEEMAATLQDWLNEFERVHLLLRLSTRLRQKHGD
ncbi:MAG TPA: thiol reductase thioredoxin [Phycisphaerales bacterium]|nr:thiol reductase thioredoxin [Phycisphaerales bacterium]